MYDFITNNKGVRVLAEYPFQSNFFQIDDHKIHYIDEGEGPVIVMVHGNPTWSYYYRNLISLLSPTHRVIAIDHIGCGLSDKPQDYDYTLANHRDNLVALLENLGVEKYSLVVHDWGGAIGVGCAGLAPERLEKLVVLNTAAFRSQRIPFRIGLCKNRFFGEFLVRGLNGFAMPAVFMAVTKPLKKEVGQSYLAPYSNWNNRIAVHRFVKDIPLTEDHPSYNTLVQVESGLKKISELKLPTLILWGGKDFCFNDSFYAEWCKRIKHAKTVYYKDGGHYILEDELEDISSRLLKFFND